ncbi:hypothetical protein BH23GEM3_BH23GEM3_26510 [soil metagenome]
MPRWRRSPQRAGARSAPSAHPSVPRVYLDGVSEAALGPTGAWVEEDRDLLADYRAAFNRTPEPLSAVGFMIDTDDTGQTAVSFLGPVRWIPAAAP